MSEELGLFKNFYFLKSSEQAEAKFKAKVDSFYEEISKKYAHLSKRTDLTPQDFSELSAQFILMKIMPAHKIIKMDNGHIRKQIDLIARNLLGEDIVGVEITQYMSNNYDKVEKQEIYRNNKLKREWVLHVDNDNAPQISNKNVRKKIVPVLKELEDKYEHESSIDFDNIGDVRFNKYILILVSSLSEGIMSYARRENMPALVKINEKFSVYGNIAGSWKEIKLEYLNEEQYNALNKLDFKNSFLMGQYMNSILESILKDNHVYFPPYLSEQDLNVFKEYCISYISGRKAEIDVDSLQIYLCGSYSSSFNDIEEKLREVLEIAYKEWSKPDNQQKFTKCCADEKHLFIVIAFAYEKTQYFEALVDKLRQLENKLSICEDAVPQEYIEDLKKIHVVWIKYSTYNESGMPAFSLIKITTVDGNFIFELVYDKCAYLPSTYE